jgi:hypothetical protein
MTRPMLMLTMVASLVAACSQTSTPQSGGAGQASPSTSPAANGQQQTPDANAAAPDATSKAAPSAAAPNQSPAAPAPKMREVTIPAGTSISVKVLSSLASNTSKVEDPVRGSVAHAVVISGETAVPAGASINGSVLDAAESGRVKGRAHIAFRFDRLVIGDETYRIQTARVAREAAADTKGDLKKGGLGAGAGAVVGAIVGGGKGAAIGAAAGGTGAVLATKGKEIQVAAGTVVSVLLQEPLTVSVPAR